MKSIDQILDEILDSITSAQITGHPVSQIVLPRDEFALLNIQCASLRSACGYSSKPDANIRTIYGVRVKADC